MSDRLGPIGGLHNIGDAQLADGLGDEPSKVVFIIDQQGGEVSGFVGHSRSWGVVKWARALVRIGFEAQKLLKHLPCTFRRYFFKSGCWF